MGLNFPKQEQKEKGQNGSHNYFDVNERGEKIEGISQVSCIDNEQAKE